MPEAPSARQAGWALGRELLLWALVSGPFLFLYAGHPAGGVQAVLPHLGVLVPVLLVMGCLRVAAWRWLPGRHLPRVTAGLLLGAVLVVMLAYYLLVLAGLWSWGRVASWTLVVNYADQVPDIARSLGVSMLTVVAMALVGLAGTLWGVDVLFTRRDWSRWLALRCSRPVAVALVCGGLLVAAARAVSIISYPPVDLREPVSLTFMPQSDQARHMSSQITVSPEALAQARADRTAYQPATAARRPNIVLVVVDALRADRMGLYGYGRDTTPYLSSLQRQGRLSIVPRVVAACPESYCGLLAIARSKPLHRLTDEDLSLHEVLRRHGYRIALILGGDHTSFYGLRQAYGQVDLYVDGSMAAGRNVNDDELVLEQVRALPAWDGRPLLLQVHLMSAHLLGLRDPRFARFQPARPYVPWSKGAAADLSRPQVETGNHYDNGVLQMDDVLRRLVQALTERQYLRDAVLVLTGDHGEMLGEHREYGHAKSVYEAAMRVPLVFAGFGTAPPAIAPSQALASQLDIAPTLAQFTGMPVPRSWSGLPLQQPLPARQLAFQQGHFVGLYHSTESGPTLKYWRHLTTGDERVYDVAADPGELRNEVSVLDRGRLDRLRAAAQPIANAVAR